MLKNYSSFNPMFPTAFGNGQAVMRVEPGDNENNNNNGGNGPINQMDTGKNKKGMILPFEPHSLTFNEIIYAVDMPQVIYKSNDPILELNFLVHAIS